MFTAIITGTMKYVEIGDRTLIAVFNCDFVNGRSAPKAAAPNVAKAFSGCRSSP